MHYISLWDMAEIGRIVRTPVKVRSDLRGYNIQPVPPDRRPQYLPAPQTLSVSHLAKTICSTHRDIYFEKVLGVRINKRDRPWQTVAGRVIHTLLQDIHSYARRCLPREGRQFYPEKLLRKLRSFGTRRKNELINRYHGDQRFAGEIWDCLNQQLANIVLFEALLVCTLLAYKASRKTVLATGTNINPAQEFEELFDFSAIEQPLSAPVLGITDPVTPDFLFASRIIGDIKTGEIHQETFETTCVAYALAYEAEYRRPIDYGIILHVGSSPQHFFPIYHGSHLFKMDDSARSRFILLREQKLDVLVTRADPGRQEDEPRCRPCPYYNRCWGAGQNG